jgi:hypothetical protein
MDPYTTLPTTAGSLDSYVGQNVDSYTNTPAAGGDPNAAAGGQNVNALEDYLKTASAAEQSQWLASNVEMTPTQSELELIIAIREAVGPYNPNIADTPQPEDIRDVLSGTDWMSLLDPQVSSPGLSNDSGPIVTTQMGSGAALPGSGSVPYDPMADSPFAKWLLYGSDTPFRDAITKDLYLKRVQEGALLLAAGAGAIATGGVLVEAGPAILGAANTAAQSISATFTAVGNLGTEIGIQLAVRAPTATALATGIGDALTGTTVPRLAIGAGGATIVGGAAFKVAKEEFSSSAAQQTLQTLGSEIASSLPSPATISTEAAALFQARDEAVLVARQIVQQELREGWISPAWQQARFGTWVDALAKSNIRQAVAAGRLPNSFVTSPTVSISRGYLRSWIRAPDVWDTATGRAWDFMAAKESAFYAHEASYLGTQAFGRLDLGGTTITEILPLFHMGFFGP